MPIFKLSTRFLLSMAVLIFVMGALWLTAVPDTLHVSTYVGIAVLLTALTAITMKADATGSLGTLLHHTNDTPTPNARPGGNGLPALRIR